jgi:excisionase family DNA binding protein
VTLSVERIKMQKDGTQPSMEPLMTAETVAQMLNVSLSMVYKLRRSGALPSVQVGALYRFHPDAVRAFMRGELPARRSR